MSIWLEILLQFLPMLLEFLKKLLERNRSLSASEKKKLDTALWYMGEVERTAVKVGATRGGVRP